jgi:alginate O-acetyltransferase complex protein AlgI
MIYSNLEFLLLLPALVVWFYNLKTNRAQNGLLLGVSIVFLAWTNPWNLLPAFTVLTTGYLWFRLNAKFGWGGRGISAIITLLLLQLIYLKYRDFISDTFALVLPIPAALGVFVPLGISFYTFEAISAIVDAQRRRTQVPAMSWGLFIMFLPHLIAGPIVRWRQLAPQFNIAKRFASRGLKVGLHLFTIGFLKKMAADPIGRLIDPLWSMPDQVNGLNLALALLGFYAQLYLDFSGYTDMGRGVARMLNFRLPVNFRAPFFAHNPGAFYQRWHVSLSGWIRTFVYDTLAVAVFRRFRSRQSQNRALFFVILVVMAIFGLWHGSSWHFVLFGVAQGLVIIGWAVATKGRTPLTSWGWGASLLMLQATWLFSLILFRSDNLSMAGKFIAGLARPSTQVDPVLLWCLVAVAGTMLSQAVDYHVRQRMVARSLAFLRGTTLGAFLVVLVLLGALTWKISIDAQIINATGGQKKAATEGFIYFRF